MAPKGLTSGHAREAPIYSEILMFPRRTVLTPHDEWQAEWKKVAEKRPELALVPHVPVDPKPAERDMFEWVDVGSLVPVVGG